MIELKEEILVLLDTNFIVDLFRFSLTLSDIAEKMVSNPKLTVTHQIVRELEKLSTKYAKVGLSMIKDGKIFVVDCPGATADDSILSFLSMEKRRGATRRVILATNDSKLRKKAESLGMRVIYLRARKHLEISD